MRVGIIAPIRSLKEYCTTGVQYCYPSLIVESKKYRDFYLEKVKEKNLVILDSVKVGWKREPETPSIVRDALAYVSPSLLITPSYMYDLKRTLRAAEEFLTMFKPKLVVGCVEGTTSEEVLACADSLRELKVKTLAIPAHIYRIQKSIPNSKLTLYLDNHLNAEELDSLNGILVTSLPVKLGLQGRLLSDYLPSPPSLTLYEEEDNFPKVVERNIEELKKFYKDEL